MRAAAVCWDTQPLDLIEQGLEELRLMVSSTPQGRPSSEWTNRLVQCTTQLQDLRASVQSLISLNSESSCSLESGVRSPAAVTATPLVAEVSRDAHATPALAPSGAGHDVPSLSQTSSSTESVSGNESESLAVFDDESTDDNSSDPPVHKQRAAAAAVVPHRRQQQTRPSSTSGSRRSSRQPSLPPQSVADSSRQQQQQQKRRRSPPPLRPSRSSTAAASGLLSLKRQRTSVRVPVAEWLAAQPLVTTGGPTDISESISTAMTNLDSVSSAPLPSTESEWTERLTTVSASMTTIATSTLRASIVAGTAWEDAIKWRTETLGYQSQSRGHLSIKDWVRSLSGFSYESVNMWVKNAKLVRQYPRLGLLAVSWGQLGQRKGDIEAYFESDAEARELWSQSI